MVKRSLALALTLSVAGTAAAHTISVQPGRRTVTAGDSTFYTVSGRAFGETCAHLTTVGFPTGITATFDDQPFCPNGQSGETKLRIASLPTTPAGTYPFAVQARVDGNPVVYQGTAVLVVEGGCPVPTLVATASPSSGEAPLSVALRVSGGGEGASYAWRFGDGGTSTETAPTHVYATAGTFDATVEVTTACGSKATSKAVVTVTSPCPVPTLVATASPSSGEAPLSVALRVSGGGEGASYAWRFGDGGTSTEAAPTHVYATAGTFDATVEVTTACGSKATAKAVVTVTSPCPVPTLVATASPSSGQAPLSVALRVTGGGEGASYSWRFGDGGTSTEAAPTHVYATAGTFDATVEVTTACGSKVTAKAVVTVTSPCPVSTLSILADPDQGAAPLSVRFDSRVEGGDVSSFEWDFADGSRATGRSATHVFTAAGSFAVRLQALDSCGVLRSASLTVVVGGRRRVVMGKKFEPTSARPRDVVRMTIRLTNETAEPLGLATVLDRLPAGLEYEGMDEGGTPQLDSGALRWTFEGASPGESLQWVVRLRVRRDAAQRLENVAELESREVTGTVRSNVAVLAVDLTSRLDKLAPPSVAPAGTIPYELRYPAGIDGAIEIVDELPSELDLVSQSSSLSFSREGRRLVWRGSTRGEEGAVRFEARVRPEVPSGTRISNEATLAFPGLEQPVVSNRVSTEVTTVVSGGGDISFRKSVDVPQSEIGRIVRYRLMLENNSASPLTSVRIEDLLPLGFSYVRATVLLDGVPGPEPIGTRRLIFTLPPVGPRGRMTLQYQTIIGPDTRRGKNLNDARLFALDASGKPVNRQASAFVNVSTDGVVFTGAIEGRVFLDRDGDSSFGSGDEPLAGVEVRLTRGLRARTDRSGAYRVEELLPGEYAVGLQPRGLPKGTVVASENPVAVILPDGAEETVDFALLLAAEKEVPKGTLEVTAFLDRDGNGMRGPEEGALPAFGVTLDSTTRYRCEAGRCVLAHLPTGVHVVRVEAEGLSSERSVNLSSGTTRLDIPLPFKGIRIEIQAVQQ